MGVIALVGSVTLLLLLGDGLHNFIGGLAIASTFLIDIRLGITAWLAAAARGEGLARDGRRRL